MSYRNILSKSRTFTKSLSSKAPMSHTPADPATILAMAEPLLVRSGGRWALSPDGEGLERNFKFKTFAKTWDFMTTVSLQCKLMNHHPEWSNVFNTTFIRWTTHNPKGLSEMDVEMAFICDAIAEDLGELEPEAPSCGIKDLADKAASASGDCCGPKE